MVYAEIYVEIEALTPTTIKWADLPADEEDENELLTGENYELDLLVEDFDLEGNWAKQIAQALYDEEKIEGLYIKEGEIKIIGPYASEAYAGVLGRYWAAPDGGSPHIGDIENTEELIEAINGYLSDTSTKLPTNHIINWNQKFDFVFAWPRNITSTHSVNISDPDEPNRWEMGF